MKSTNKSILKKSRALQLDLNPIKLHSFKPLMSDFVLKCAQIAKASSRQCVPRGLENKLRRA